VKWLGHVIINDQTRAAKKSFGVSQKIEEKREDPD
jgi:hypothetical protein